MLTACVVNLYSTAITMQRSWTIYVLDVLCHCWSPSSARVRRPTMGLLLAKYLMSDVTINKPREANVQLSLRLIRKVAWLCILPVKICRVNKWFCENITWWCHATGEITYIDIHGPRIFRRSVFNFCSRGPDGYNRLTGSVWYFVLNFIMMMVDYLISINEMTYFWSCNRYQYCNHDLSNTICSPLPW